MDMAGNVLEWCSDWWASDDSCRVIRGGCWGYDVYYRWSGAQYERATRPGCLEKDGGYTHHFGGKLTYEGQFGSKSRFYWWVGVGAGYFMDQDYWFNDEGFEVYGELGVGYVLSKNFRVRVGVNVHGADTAVTRRDPIDDGQSRWLWLIAPVAQLEINF